MHCFARAHSRPTHATHTLAPAPRPTHAGTAEYLATNAWKPHLLDQWAKLPHNGGSGDLRHTLEIELYDDAWLPSVGEEGSAATNLLLGAITSRQDEPYGWNNIVRARLTAANLMRSTDTRVTITLPDAANYSIDVPDTIEITIPAKCVVSDAYAAFTGARSIVEPTRLLPCRLPI